MSARDDLAFLLRRHDRRMNRWRRDLRDEVMVAFNRRTVGKEKVDTLALALLRMDIDRIYSNAYARWPGDDSAPLGRIIRSETRYARWLAFWRSWQDVVRRSRAAPDLLRAIREAA